ncbi:MAG: fumarylacetoacetate hydrolase family protein [Pseudomonadota bacterium]
MSSFLFPPMSPISVPTTEGKLFPIRRVFCIAKNYAGHVREMGGDPATTPPVFYNKPTDAMICPSSLAPQVKYPLRTKNLHFEGEFVLALKSGGENISIEEALSHLYGVAMGCDLTRRDLQQLAKDQRGPWDVGKSFDQSAVMGPVTPMTNLPMDQAFTLSVNNKNVQAGTVSDMIFPPAQIIAELSTYYELKAGDLIYTGTPQGVAEIKRGDRIRIKSEGLASLEFVME